jgi:hypothetical protein
VSRRQFRRARCRFDYGSGGIRRAASRSAVLGPVSRTGQSMTLNGILYRCSGLHWYESNQMTLSISIPMRLSG